MITTRCAYCGALIPENSRFCPECGKSVAVEKRCSQCGALLTGTEKFCSQCGAPVTPPTSAPQTETAKPKLSEQHQPEVVDFVKCPKCGALLPATAKTCDKCGYTLAYRMEKREGKRTCPTCGALVSDMVRVCPECGCRMGPAILKNGSSKQNKSLEAVDKTLGSTTQNRSPFLRPVVVMIICAILIIFLVVLVFLRYRAQAVHPVEEPAGGENIELPMQQGEEWQQTMPAEEEETVESDEEETEEPDNDAEDNGAVPISKVE